MKTFDFVPEREDLKVLKVTSEMTLYEPFLMEEPQTKCEDMPEDDRVYYKSLEAQLVHLLYKYRKNWITSERQVQYTSDECISVIHFTFDADKEVIGMNVFQRSSNVLNLEDDVQFLRYFILKYCNPFNVSLKIFVSQPHIFNNKLKKVEN